MLKLALHAISVIIVGLWLLVDLQNRADLQYLVRMEHETEEGMAMLYGYVDDVCKARDEQRQRGSF